MQDGEKILGGMVENTFGDYAIARTYAYAGHGEKMFKYLEESFVNKERGLTYIKVQPVFDRYRKDPRFVQLMKNMNFVD